MVYKVMTVIIRLYPVQVFLQLLETLVVAADMAFLLMADQVLMDGLAAAVVAAVAVIMALRDQEVARHRVMQAALADKSPAVAMLAVAAVVVWALSAEMVVEHRSGTPALVA